MHLLLSRPVLDALFCREQVEIKLPLAWDRLKTEHIFKDVGETAHPGWEAEGDITGGNV